MLTEPYDGCRVGPCSRQRLVLSHIQTTHSYVMVVVFWWSFNSYFVKAAFFFLHISGCGFD